MDQIKLLIPSTNSLAFYHEFACRCVLSIDFDLILEDRQLTVAGPGRHISVAQRKPVKGR